MTPDALMTILKIVGIFVLVSFVVFWVGLVWWVAQDILTRTRDKIIIAAAVAITAILGPVGILIYLVVRPRQTLKERFGEMMEREMMLQASAITVCPTCERVAHDDFVACPYCGTVLKKACIECGKLLAMDWQHCPFCGAGQKSLLTEATQQPEQSPNPEVAILMPAAKTQWSEKARPVIEALRSLVTPVPTPYVQTIEVELAGTKSSQTGSNNDEPKSDENSSNALQADHVENSPKSTAASKKKTGAAAKKNAKHKKH
jgi:RNA polymerase subunit RPABC4/transcription elongation factor Spt4